MVSARNETIMNGGFFPNQKVFKIYSKGKKELDQCNPSELEKEIVKKLIEIMKKTRQSKRNVELECQNIIKRDLKATIRPYKIEEEQLGNGVITRKEMRINREGLGMLFVEMGKSKWLNMVH